MARTKKAKKNAPPPPALADEADLWQRLLQKRRHQCESLPSAVLQQICDDNQQEEEPSSLPEQEPSLVKSVERMIRHYLSITSSQENGSAQRRAALNSLQSIFKSIEDAYQNQVLQSQNSNNNTQQQPLQQAAASGNYGAAPAHRVNGVITQSTVPPYASLQQQPTYASSQQQQPQKPSITGASLKPPPAAALPKPPPQESARRVRPPIRPPGRETVEQHQQRPDETAATTAASQQESTSNSNISQLSFQQVLAGAALSTGFPVPNAANNNNAIRPSSALRGKTIESLSTLSRKHTMEEKKDHASSNHAPISNNNSAEDAQASQQLHASSSNDDSVSFAPEDLGSATETLDVNGATQQQKKNEKIRRKLEAKNDIFADGTMTLLMANKFEGKKKKKSAVVDSRHFLVFQELMGGKGGTMLWGCTLCRMNNLHEVCLVEHCAGRKHQGNLEKWVKEQNNAAAAKPSAAAPASRSVNGGARNISNLPAWMTTQQQKEKTQQTNGTSSHPAQNKAAASQQSTSAPANETNETSSQLAQNKAVVPQQPTVAPANRTNETSSQLAQNKAAALQHSAAASANGTTSRWGPPRSNSTSPIPLQQNSVMDNSSVRRGLSAASRAGQNVTIVAQADRKQNRFPTFACTQTGRALVRATFKTPSIEDVYVRMTNQRLKEWDPFWTPIMDVATNVTTTVHHLHPRTTLINYAAAEEFSFSSGSPIVTLLKWGKPRSEPWQNGEMALILRMLPLDASTKKRADCHLWPKGTFLQINGQPVKLEQRRQQSHNEKEWKGMCRELCVSPWVGDPTKPTKIELCSFENAPFYYSLKVCEYTDADHLYNSMTDPGNEKAIKCIPSDIGKDLAIEFASHQTTVNLDSDDEGDHNHDDAAKFIFSLSCPISKQLMQYPVRGKACKHWQVSTKRIVYRYVPTLLL